MLLVIVWLLTTPAHAQDTGGAQAPAPEPEPAAASALPRLPVLVDAPPAPYPEAALAEGQEGTVLLELAISALGEVVSAEVVEPAGLGFDEAALAAVRNFRFDPALDAEGEPVGAVIQYRYVFSLERLPVLAVSGRVRAAGTRQPLAQATVTLLDDTGRAIEAATDAQGDFRFVDVPDGDYALAARAPGFEQEVTAVAVVSGRVSEATFFLRPARTWEQLQADDEMVIEEERVEPEVIERRLRADEIRSMPGTGGDIVRAVQSLPGVARSPFNAGQVVVRGTSPNDSAFTLGGAPIPIVFHFGGLSTVINSDSLGEVAYLPGNYGVRYGRRLGGVVDLRTDKNLPERSWGYASIDLFQAALFAEGKLGDRWAVTLSGRRSYIGALLSPIVNTSPSTNIRLPTFSDGQLRTLYRADNGSTLDMMGIFSDDRFSYTETDVNDPDGGTASVLKIQFTKGWLQWQQVLGGGWLSELTISGGPEETSANYEDEDEVFDRHLGGALRYEVFRDVPEDGWAGWRAGVDVIAEQVEFNYSIEEFSDFTSFTGNEEGDAGIVYPSVYLEQTQREGRLEGVPGVRIDGMVTDGDYAAFSVDPRFALRFQATDETRYRASVGRYSQFPQVREVIGRAGEPGLLPEWAIQSSVGVDHTFRPGLTAELTAYHLWMRDLVIGREDRFEFILGPPPTPPLDTDDYANDATGLSYGTEGLVRYEDPRLVAWAGATLSRSTRVKRPGDDRSRFEYDQPLVLTAVGSYKLPRNLTAGLRLRYASGNPYTPVANRGFYLNEHTYYPIYDLNNSARMPAYFTVDARIDKVWTFQRWRMTGYLDLLNATNRRNVELINFSYDYSEEIRVFGLPIIPAFGLRGEW